MLKIISDIRDIAFVPQYHTHSAIYCALISKWTQDMVVLRQKKRTEEQECIALINWVRKHGLHLFPVLKMLYHIPNGGSRHVVEAVKLKRMGVLKGVSDYCLPVARKGFYGLYIEMKSSKGKLSTEQLSFGELLKEQGYSFAVCKSAEEAITMLVSYLAGNPIEKEYLGYDVAMREVNAKIAANVMRAA